MSKELKKYIPYFICFGFIVGVAIAGIYYAFVK